MKILSDFIGIAEAWDKILAPNDCIVGVTGKRGKIKHAKFGVVNGAGVAYKSPNATEGQEFLFMFQNPNTDQWEESFGLLGQHAELLEQSIKNLINLT